MRDQKWMTGLKGLGALGIALGWHYCHFGVTQFPFEKILGVFFHRGAFLVELFFLLSGFGMVLGYEKRIFHQKVSFTSYIKKRFLHIYPMYLETLILTAAIQFVFIKLTGTTFVYPDYDIYHFFLNVFGIQNVISPTYSFNGPAWCISVTLLMYVVFFIVVRSIRDKVDQSNSIYVYIALALVSFGLFTMMLPYPFVNMLCTRGAACFFIGCVIAELYQRIREKDGRWIGYGAYILLIFSLVFRNMWGGEMWIYTLAITPLWVLSIAFIPWRKMLYSNPIFVYLGKISMSIYLIHFPVQCLISTLDHYFNLQLNYSSKVVYIGISLTILLIAWINYYLMDYVTKRIMGRNANRKIRG